MLLKKSELDAIKARDVSLVFRRWQRPSVKSGGTLKTAVGVLAIDRVSQVERSAITRRDAEAAGYGDVAELRRALDAHQGSIYRIEVRFLGPDPRIGLREQAHLDPTEMEAVAKKLARLDAASHSGPWTRSVLRTIAQHPRVAAGDLAARLGLDRARLKVNVRKLKNLGLTLSHETGYELSPRGRAVLARLEDA